MAIGLQKLSAGSGYEYLTRQVAAMDATGHGHTTLAAYYSAKGEAPGHWYGGGLAGVGLAPGDEVSAEQMKLLFGAGLDPVTGEPLGRRYPLYANQPTSFDIELARRIAGWQSTHLEAVPHEVRDQLRTTLAHEWFQAEYGRGPSGPRELHGFIVKAITRARRGVAGFDVTFTPAKSVSALWAVAPPDLAATIRAAHHAAVADAMTFAERQVVFTRQGHNGVRHVEVRGLLAAVFVHRDSRAGDPNLHSHVAIANKVQTLSGEWLSLDAQVLYRAKVTLSETYTSSLQARLINLGLSFVAAGRDGGRPVYEVAGVDPRLTSRWSSRRHQVVVRTGELVARFQADHERPPTPLEKLDLAQQATLDTRRAKHDPRSEADQRATWQAEADQVLGRDGLTRMLSRVLSTPRSLAPVMDDALVARLGQQVITVVESQRSSWTSFHIRAEALRQVRAVGVTLEQLDAAVDRVVAHALSPERSIAIATTRVMPVEPPMLRRGRDGESVYAPPSATQYTSTRILWAEQRLIDTAGRGGGRVVDANSVTLALLQSLANHQPLNPSQQLLVHQMACSGRRLQVAIAPAGTGKTSAMRALAIAWTSSGGNVVGLAPSAAAADQLHARLRDGTSRVVADNLAKLVWAIAHAEPLADKVGPRTLLIIDEAGMADTLTLDHVVTWAIDRGASVRLVGDDQQLGAIGAGGILRDITASHGALRLTDPVRYTDPAEAAATLALRAGDTGCLGFYLDHDRIHVVDPDTATTSLLTAWRTDRAAGLDAIMLAPTRTQVAQLNHAARLARLDGVAPERQVPLADGNVASVGDTIITRRNNRSLTTGDTVWVRNGDRWQVTAVRPDGALDVHHLRTRTQLTLPADYVTTSVELGYATTIHAAQGVTADTCHGLLTGAESRQLAYTMLSRGRTANHAWIQISDIDPHTAPAAQPMLQPFTATQVLESIITRDDTPISATTLLAQADDPARLLGPAVSCYLDAIAFAANHHLDTATKNAIDQAGHEYGLTLAEAWPTLRSHLILAAANGHDPHLVLRQAVALGSLDTARDPAAVIDYRLDLTHANTRTRGPLPWLPGIPTQLLDTPEWKTYLSARFRLTKHLADETLRSVDSQTPAWAHHLPAVPPALLDTIRVWRAAHTTPDTDLRPTGPTTHTPAERAEQRLLEVQLDTANHRIQRWIPRIVQSVPSLAGDPGLPALAEQLATLAHHGYNAARLLKTAANTTDLPDDHAADALTYRITTIAASETPRREWETITPSTRRPLEDEPHPSHHTRDRSPGISR